MSRTIDALFEDWERTMKERERKRREALIAERDRTLDELRRALRLASKGERGADEAVRRYSEELRRIEIALEKERARSGKGGSFRAILGGLTVGGLVAWIFQYAGTIAAIVVVASALVAVWWVYKRK